MKNKLNKFMVWALTFAILMTFIPTISLVNALVTNVAKINETNAEYETVAAALSAAESGQTVTLLANSAENLTIPEGVYFSGGDYTVSGLVTNNGTIENGSFTHTGYDPDILNNGTISGGTFAGSVNNTGTIDSGVFSDTVYNKGGIISGIAIFNYGFSNEGGRINGGIFNCRVTNDMNRNAESIIQNGTFNDSVENRINGIITGGNFTNTSISPAVANYGTISGGVYSGKVECYSGSEIAGATFNGNITVYGGALRGGTYEQTVSIKADYPVTVTGGTFNGSEVGILYNWGVLDFSGVNPETFSVVIESAYAEGWGAENRIPVGSDVSGINCIILHPDQAAYRDNTEVNNINESNHSATTIGKRVAPTTYTVSFDANGGTGTMADVNNVSGEYALPENGFTAPAGKQFKAWSVGDTEKAVGATITISANTTVTALWEDIVETYADYNILSDDLTHVQTVLTGLADVTKDTSTGVVTIKLTSNVNGRIRFNDNSGKFVIDLGGKTINPGNRNEALCLDNNFDGIVTITGDGIIKKGANNIVYNWRATLNFAVAEGKDYFSLKNGDDNVFAERNTTTKEFTGTFTWSGESFIITQGVNSAYTVIFDANNGTSETDTQEVANGSDYTLTDDIFTYGKCEIEEWTTEPDGSGTAYSIGDVITVTADITLYAQWVLPLNELESFTDGDLEWSGNSSSPYTFTMNNSAVLYARVILPGEADNSTTITANGNCEIKGAVSFKNNTGYAQKSSLTINGSGNLKLYEMTSTGAGDTLMVETDVTILSDYMSIGASGGEDSKIVIDDATLTVHDLTLLQYLTMNGNAKLNVLNGRASFHGAPEITLSDDSEIYIEGDGDSCVLYKENGANDAFDALISGNWLPEGYSFNEDDQGYYYLYDTDGIETDSITIKKRKQNTASPSNVGGITRHTVKFNTNGGSDVANKTVTRYAKITEPATPVNDGYTFAGWYIDKELTTAYDFNSRVTNSFTLYAKWEKIDADNNGTSGHYCPSLKFSDLDITKWYHEDTDYVIENDIFRGTTKTTFAPNADITRGMMITILYRAESEPDVSGTYTFEDVDENMYYAKAIVWGQQNGIIKGYSETEYAPEKPVLREQIAAIMFRYAQYKGMNAVTLEENLHFTDSNEISEYAISAMNWAVGTGLIKGYEDNTVRPLNNATRVEVAAMLHRFIESNK